MSQLDFSYFPFNKEELEKKLEKVMLREGILFDLGHPNFLDFHTRDDIFFIDIQFESDDNLHFPLSMPKRENATLDEVADMIVDKIKLFKQKP